MVGLEVWNQCFRLIRSSDYSNRLTKNDEIKSATKILMSGQLNAINKAIINHHAKSVLNLEATDIKPKTAAIPPRVANLCEFFCLISAAFSEAVYVWGPGQLGHLFYFSNNPSSMRLHYLGKEKGEMKQAVVGCPAE